MATISLSSALVIRPSSSVRSRSSSSIAPAAPAALRLASGTARARGSLACRAAAEIDVNFVTAEGTKTVKCAPGAVLRDVMLDNDVELYTTWGKIWSCGGYGQCGTCTVNVTGGMELLPAEKSQPEEKHLNKKPDTWRLACQCTVGDGAEEGGSLTIETLPQKK